MLQFIDIYVNITQNMSISFIITNVRLDSLFYARTSSPTLGALKMGSNYIAIYLKYQRFINLDFIQP